MLELTVLSAAPPLVPDFKAALVTVVANVDYAIVVNTDPNSPKLPVTNFGWSRPDRLIVLSSFQLDEVNKALMAAGTAPLTTTPIAPLSDLGKRVAKYAEDAKTNASYISQYVGLGSDVIHFLGTGERVGTLVHVPNVPLELSFWQKHKSKIVVGSLATALVVGVVLWPKHE